MAFNCSYKTISKDSEIELIEKKSRFIGRCFPVSTEEEALKILDQIRKENWNATHNCFAYIIKNGSARYSDDGEPSGTAGLPIIEVMNHLQITNALVVVTRYFGGILLGTGGLVRAYSKAASLAVNAAKILHMIPCTAYQLMIPYSQWNITQSICEKYGTIQNPEFTDTVTCTAWIKDKDSDLFVRDLIDKTDGRIVPMMIKNDWFPFLNPEDRI